MWWDENDQVTIFKVLNLLSMSKFDFVCSIHKVHFFLSNVNLQVSKLFKMCPLPYICLTIWHTPAISQVLIGQHLIFTYRHDQCAVTCLENVRQLNIRQRKKLDFVIKCWVVNVLEKRSSIPYCKIISKSACCWWFRVFFLLVVSKFRSL